MSKERRRSTPHKNPYPYDRSKVTFNRSIFTLKGESDEEEQDRSDNEGSEEENEAKAVPLRNQPVEKAVPISSSSSSSTVNNTPYYYDAPPLTPHYFNTSAYPVMSGSQPLLQTMAQASSPFLYLGVPPVVYPPMFAAPPYQMLSQPMFSQLPLGGQPLGFPSYPASNPFHPTYNLSFATPPISSSSDKHLEKTSPFTYGKFCRAKNKLIAGIAAFKQGHTNNNAIDVWEKFAKKVDEEWRLHLAKSKTQVDEPPKKMSMFAYAITCGHMKLAHKMWGDLTSEQQCTLEKLTDVKLMSDFKDYIAKNSQAAPPYQMLSQPMFSQLPLGGQPLGFPSYPASNPFHPTYDLSFATSTISSSSDKYLEKDSSFTYEQFRWAKKKLIAGIAAFKQDHTNNNAINVWEKFAKKADEEERLHLAKSKTQIDEPPKKMSMFAYAITCGHMKLAHKMWDDLIPTQQRTLEELTDVELMSDFKDYIAKNPQTESESLPASSSSSSSSTTTILPLSEQTKLDVATSDKRRKPEEEQGKENQFKKRKAVTTNKNQTSQSLSSPRSSHGLGISTNYLGLFRKLASEKAEEKGSVGNNASTFLAPPKASGPAQTQQNPQLENHNQDKAPANGGSSKLS